MLLRAVGEELRPVATPRQSVGAEQLGDKRYEAQSWLGTYHLSARAEAESDHLILVDVGDAVLFLLVLNTCGACFSCVDLWVAILKNQTCLRRELLFAVFDQHRNAANP